MNRQALNPPIARAHAAPDIRGLTLDPVLPLSATTQPSFTEPDFHALLGLAADAMVLPTYSGTTAIYQGLKAVGVGPGDRVLVPSYNCGHEVEAVLRTGAGIECYRIGPDLQIDLDDLRRLLKQPASVVMVTHYFGFPQALAEIGRVCREAGVLLLENAVPALFSSDGQRALGSIGDIAAFSFRKTLPIPVGGALVFRRSVAAGNAAPLLPPPALTCGRRASHLAYKALVRRSPGVGGWWRRLAASGVLGARGLCIALQHVSVLAGRPQHDLDSEDYGFPPEVLYWGMDAYSRRLLAGFRPKHIAARRRRYFNLLHAGLHCHGEAANLLPAAGGSTVPLHYVLMARDRAQFLTKLRRCGVPALDWWSGFHPAVDWEQFPDAVRLKQSLIALPVHQDLEECQVAGMLARIQGLMPEEGPG